MSAQDAVKEKYKIKIGKTAKATLIAAFVSALSGVVGTKFFDNYVLENPYRNESIIQEYEKTTGYLDNLQRRRNLLSRRLPDEKNIPEGLKLHDIVLADDRKRVAALDLLIKETESYLGQVKQNPRFKEYSEWMENRNEYHLLISGGSMLLLISSMGLGAYRVIKLDQQQKNEIKVTS